MEINGYILENREKLQRVFDLFKKEEKDINDHELILAYYDREGGRITKNRIKVDMGMFWDFGKRKAKCEIEREKAQKLKEDAEKLFKEKIKKSERLWNKIKIIVTILGLLGIGGGILYYTSIQNNINGNNIGTQINNYSK